MSTTRTKQDGTMLLELYETATLLASDYRIVFALTAAAFSFDVDAAMLDRGTREQPAATARHVAWWLVHDVYGLPDTAIASDVGLTRRSIGHGIKHTEAMIQVDHSARERIAQARATLLQLDPQPQIQ